MICPICKTENTDNWPVKVDGEIKEGGCQDCWERQSDNEWWKAVNPLMFCKWEKCKYGK